MTLRVSTMIFKTKYLIFLIIFLYFLTRFQNLLALPVFGDEAIYIRWAQIIRNVETLRFIPLTDGKQPLFMWLTAASLKFFSDPLFVGRFISILSGFGILIGLFLLYSLILNYSSRSLDPLGFFLESSKKSTFSTCLPSLIYLLLPYSFFFDRLALPDNLLSFIGISSLILVILLSKYPRLDLAMILGFILGLGWITKSPAVYFVFLSLFSYGYLRFPSKSNFYLPIISIFISYFIYNLLRLGPQFHMIALRNQDYLWPINDIIRHPLDPLKPHLVAVSKIYLQYLSLPLIFIFLVSLLATLRKFTKQRIFKILFLWWFLPVFINSLFSKVMTGRYLLFSLPPLIILISLSLHKFYLTIHKNFKNVFIPALFIFSLFANNIFWMLKASTSPFNLKLVDTEKGYFSDWTSGWGIKPASEFLKNRAKIANVIVGTEGYFGTLPDGLQIYTDNIKQLTVFGVGLGFDRIPGKLIDAKNHGDEVYLLINQSRLKLHPDEMKLVRIVKEYPKPEDDSLLLIQI